jgi:DNA-directed RNA polymerase subunit F
VIGKRVVSEKPVTLGEVQKILEKEKKGELDYVQRLAYDYVQKFAPIDAERAEKLKEELLALEKLREHQVVAIIDLMPETKEDLEILFQKERVRPGEEDFKKILEVVEKYRK